MQFIYHCSIDNFTDVPNRYYWWSVSGKRPYISIQAVSNDINYVLYYALYKDNKYNNW